MVNTTHVREHYTKIFKTASGLPGWDMIKDDVKN